MGVDLTFLPFDHDDGGLSFSHTVLPCCRRKKLFQEVQEIPTKKVPKDFTTHLSRDEQFSGPHYGDTQEDAYGHDLQWCYAHDLVKLGDHDGVTDNPRNRAVWAYLKHLPDYTKVALYWN